MSYDPSVLHRQATRWPYTGQPVDDTPLTDDDFYGHATEGLALVPREEDAWQRKLGARTVTPDDMAARPWVYPQGPIPPAEACTEVGAGAVRVRRQRYGGVNGPALAMLGALVAFWVGALGGLAAWWFK